MRAINDIYFCLIQNFSAESRIEQEVQRVALNGCDNIHVLCEVGAYTILCLVMKLADQTIYKLYNIIHIEQIFSGPAVALFRHPTIPPEHISII